MATLTAELAAARAEIAAFSATAKDSKKTPPAPNGPEGQNLQESHPLPIKPSGLPDVSTAGAMVSKATMDLPALKSQASPNGKRML